MTGNTVDTLHVPRPAEGGEAPLVSIIIPSYNHARYIGDAIESVLNQTYRNIELIVIDDGSRDDSHAVIRGYADDPRVTVILNTENRGQSFVLNHALEVAKGTLVSFLPSDDWYLPRKTELQVAKFLLSGPEVGVVYAGGARYFEDTGETRVAKLPVFTGKVAEKFIEWGSFVYPVTPMFRRECFEREPMDEGFKAEGEAVYIRIALHYEFEYVDEVVAVMRDHSYNIGKDPYVMYGEVRDYWIKFFANPDLPKPIRKMRRVAMMRLHRIYGLRFIGEFHDFRASRRCLLRAIAEQPRLLLDPKVMGALVISLLPRKAATALTNRFASGRSDTYHEAN